MSTFSSINQASRALSAAQRGMEVTGQNIANANTDGYSRQRVEQSAGVLVGTGQFAQRHAVGNGVDVTGISRAADALATATARQDAATARELATTGTVWAGIEAALGDTGATGLSKELSDLSSAWNDLVKTGKDGLPAARGLVVTRSQAVASTLKGMDSQLQAQFEQLGLQAGALAENANATAANIAQLNASIRSTLAAGGSANELLDQRDQQLDALAGLTGARVVERQDGTVDVLVGNAVVVTGEFSSSFAVTPSTGNPQVREGDRYVLTVGGQEAEPSSGSLKGVLDGANKVLAQQSDALDAFTADLAAKVNGAYGGTFFESSAAPAAPTAYTVRVAGALTTAPDSLVDSSSGSNRSVAQAVLGSLTDVKSGWRREATTLAAATQSADNRATLAAQVSLKSGTAREAVSGVNIDEEMASLVAYQHAYSAAARVLTTIDEALDTLIQRTGVVGR